MKNKEGGAGTRGGEKNVENPGKRRCKRNKTIENINYEENCKQEAKRRSLGRKYFEKMINKWKWME